MAASAKERARAKWDETWDQEPPAGDGDAPRWEPQDVDDDCYGVITDIRSGEKDGPSGKYHWEWVTVLDGSEQWQIKITPYLRRQIDALVAKDPACYQQGAELYVRCVERVDMVNKETGEANEWLKCYVGLTAPAGASAPEPSAPAASSETDDDLPF